MLTGEGPAMSTADPPPVPEEREDTWQCDCHNGFDVYEHEWGVEDPHIERCDSCERYADDEEAGKAAEAEGVPGAWDLEDGLYYVCAKFHEARNNNAGDGYWAGWVPGMIP